MLFQFGSHGFCTTEGQLFDLVEVGVNVFQRAQTGDQTNGGFLADFRYTRDVIDLVAH